MVAVQAFITAQKMILRKRGIVGLLYLINLLVAAVLTIPLASSLRILGQTALSEGMLDGFYYDNFYGFWSRHSLGIQTLFATALLTGVLYTLMNSYFAGGILRVLAAETRFSMKAFLQASGEFFGRYFRLFLLSLVVLVVFALAFHFAVIKPLGEYADSLNPDAQMRVYILIVLFALLILGFWNMLFDYAKIVIFSRNSKSVSESFLSGVGFVFRNFAGAVSLYYINYFIIFAFFGIYLFIESFFNNSTAGQTYTLLAIQQVLVICRLWIKISFFASQQLYYYEQRPEESVQSRLAGIMPTF